MGLGATALSLRSLAAITLMSSLVAIAHAQTSGLYTLHPDGQVTTDTEPELYTLHAGGQTTLTAKPALIPEAASRAVPSPISASRPSPAACLKNIAFAIASDGQVNPVVPTFVEKWIAKNRKKLSGLCFSQRPNLGTRNYILILSYQQSAAIGIYPTVRTSTDTAVTPVSGSGTVTDYRGSMWTYNYTGTQTTTTTTTTYANLPYTDTSDTLYLYSYDQRGRQVSGRWRTVSRRQGGDAANTLGYNLGSMLSSIHVKERLLDDVLKDVVKD
jgi:hypothetical protein